MWREAQFDPKAVDAFSAEEEVLREMVIAKCCLAEADLAAFDGFTYRTPKRPCFCYRDTGDTRWLSYGTVLN